MADLVQGVSLQVVVRWDPTGGWHATNGDDIAAAIRATSLKWEAGENITSGSVGALTPSRLRFEVWNASGDFSPDNDRSPYNTAPKSMAVGRLIEISFTRGDDTERTWTGVISKMTPRIRNLGGNFLSVVEFECLGSLWKWLDSKYEFFDVQSHTAGAFARIVATHIGMDKSTSGEPTGDWRDSLRGDANWSESLRIGKQGADNDFRARKVLADLAATVVGGLDDQTGVRGQVQLKPHSAYRVPNEIPQITLAEQQPAPADLEGHWIAIDDIKDSTDERTWYSDFEAQAVLGADESTAKPWAADKTSGGDLHMLAQWGGWPNSAGARPWHSGQAGGTYEADFTDWLGPTSSPGVGPPTQSSGKRITTVLTAPNPTGQVVTSVTWFNKIMIAEVQYWYTHTYTVRYRRGFLVPDATKENAVIEFGKTSVSITWAPFYYFQWDSQSRADNARYFSWVGVFGQRHVVKEPDNPLQTKKTDIPSAILVTGRKSFPVKPTFLLESAATTYLNRISRRYGKLHRLVTVDATPKTGQDFMRLLGLRDGAVVKVVSGDLHQVRVNQRMIVKTRRVWFDGEQIGHFSFDLLSTDAYYDAPDTGAPEAPTLTTTVNRLRGTIKIDIAGTSAAVSHEIAWRHQDETGWPASKRATATGRTASHTISGLTTGDYDVRVRSLDTDGDAGPWAYSENHNILVVSPPRQPTVTLSATGSSITVRVSGATGTGTVIEYRRQGATNWTPFATVTASEVTRTITGLAAGEYQVRTHSTNLGGRSAYVVQTFPTLPSAPTLTTTSQTDGLTVRVRGASLATGAVVAHRAVGTGGWTETLASGRNPNVVLRLAAGSYQVRAASTNAAGRGPWSNVRTTDTQPERPTVAVDVVGTTAEVSIIGSVTAARHGYSSRQTGSWPADRTVTGRAASVNLTNRAAGDHQLRVRSISARGVTGAYRTVSFHIVPPAPGAPTLTLTGLSGGLRVAVAGARYAATHELQSKASTASAWSAATTLAGRNVTHTVTGLDEGTYDVRVRSIGTGGTGPYRTVTGQQTLPDQPPAVVPATTIDSLSVTLAKSVTATGWEFQWALAGDAYTASSRQTGTFSGSMATVTVGSLSIKRYKIRWRFVNAAGKSDWRELASVAVGSTVAPARPTITLVPSLTSIAVTFAASENADEVQIQWRVKGDTTAPDADHTATVSGFGGTHAVTVAEGEWEVRAAAENDIGRSAWTAWAGTVTHPSPPVLTLKGLFESIMATWTESPIATETRLRWKLTSQDTYPAANTATVTAGKKTHTITGLEDGGQYHIWAQSSNRLGNKSAATEAYGRTNIPDVRLTALSATQIRVVIEGVEGATSHQIHWRQHGQTTYPTAKRLTVSGQDSSTDVTTGAGHWDFRVRSWSGVNSRFFYFDAITLPAKPAVTATFGMGRIDLSIAADPVAVTAMIAWHLASGKADPKQTHTLMLSSSAATTYAIRKLKSGSWTVTVDSANAAGGKAVARASHTGTVAEAPPIPDPPAVAVTGAVNGVSVAITGDSSATAHELQSRTAAGNAWSAATALSGRSPTHTVTGSETPYFVRVRSALQAGGPWSAWTEASGHALPGAPELEVSLGALGTLNLFIEGTTLAVSHLVGWRVGTSGAWSADIALAGHDATHVFIPPNPANYQFRASSLNADGEEGPETVQEGTIRLATSPVTYDMTAAATPDTNLSIRLGGRGTHPRFRTLAFFEYQFRVVGGDWPVDSFGFPSVTRAPGTIQYNINNLPIVVSTLPNFDFTVPAAGTYDVRIRGVAGTTRAHFVTPAGSPVTVTAGASPQADAISLRSGLRVEWGHDNAPQMHRLQWSALGEGTSGTMLGEAEVDDESGYTIPDLADGAYDVEVQELGPDGQWSAATRVQGAVPPSAPATPTPRIIPGAVDSVTVEFDIFDAAVESYQMFVAWGSSGNFVPTPVQAVSEPGLQRTILSGRGAVTVLVSVTWQGGATATGSSVTGGTLPEITAHTAGVNADRIEWTCNTDPAAAGAQVAYRMSGDTEWELLDMAVAAQGGFEVAETGFAEADWQYRLRAIASDSAGGGVYEGPWSPPETVTVAGVDATIDAAVPGPPRADTGHFGTAAGIYTRTMSVAWDAPLAYRHRVAGYDLSITAGTDSSTVATTAARASLSDLAPDTAHTLRVRARFDTDAVSDWSTPTVLTTASGAPRQPAPRFAAHVVPGTAHEFLAVVWGDVQGDVENQVWRVLADHYAPVAEGTGGQNLPVSDTWDCVRETLHAETLAGHGLTLATVRVPVSDVVRTLVAVAEQAGGAEIRSAVKNVDIAEGHAAAAGIVVLIPHADTDYDTILIQDDDGNAYVPFDLGDGHRLPERVTARLRNASTGAWLTDTVRVFDAGQTALWPWPLASQDALNGAGVSDELQVAYAVDAAEGAEIGATSDIWTVGPAGDYQTLDRA